MSASASQPNLVTVTATVIAGPETAARLGVPVGTVIDGREVRRYRSRLRQLVWRVMHPHTGRITPHQPNRS